MSSPTPIQLTGSYTREFLSALLRGISEQKQSGVLYLTTDERVGSIHFMQGKLAAADFAGLGGVQAFHAIAADKAGKYEFKAGFVQFSQIGMDKRIYATLESLLSTPALEIAVSNEAAPDPSVNPPVFNLDAFDLEALTEDNLPESRSDFERSAVTMPASFGKALLAEFVRNVGPAGYVLIEEIALDLRIDLQAISQDQAARLTTMMVGQVPVSKRSAFQSSCSSLIEQFKP